MMIPDDTANVFRFLLGYCLCLLVQESIQFALDFSDRRKKKRECNKK